MYESHQASVENPHSKTSTSYDFSSIDRILFQIKSKQIS